MDRSDFFFNDTATTEIYTYYTLFPYTTLFRSVKPTFNVLVAGDLQDPNPANRTRLTSFFVSDTLGAFDEKVELTLGLRRQQIYLRTYDITAGDRKRVA